jgi:hypothetical protein
MIHVEFAKNAVIGIQERHESAFHVEMFLATTRTGFIMHVVTTSAGYATLVKELAAINLDPDLLQTRPFDGQQVFEVLVNVPANWTEPNGRNHAG